MVGPNLQRRESSLNGGYGAAHRCVLTFATRQPKRKVRFSSPTLSGLVRRLFGHQVVVEPHRGTLLIMRGNTTLHSVRAVLGESDRIAVVLAYDFAGQEYRRNALNDYLYTSAHPSEGDPNYRA